jgi:hypothetical protein
MKPEQNHARHGRAGTPCADLWYPQPAQQTFLRRSIRPKPGADGRITGTPVDCLPRPAPFRGRPNFERGMITDGGKAISRTVNVAYVSPRFCTPCIQPAFGDFRGCRRMRPARGDLLRPLPDGSFPSTAPAEPRQRLRRNDGTGRDGARRDPERRRQVIDRDHQDVVLTPLYSTSSNEAQDRQRAAATPPSPAARQPHRLLVRQGEMAPLVGPGR